MILSHAHYHVFDHLKLLLTLSSHFKLDRSSVQVYLQFLVFDYSFTSYQASIHSKYRLPVQSVDVSRCDHVTSQGLASLIDGQSFLQKINAADSLHVSWYS